MPGTQDSSSYLSWLSSGLKVAVDVLVDAVKADIVGSAKLEEDVPELITGLQKEDSTCSGD